MAEKILDDVKVLMDLSEDDLNEILIDEKYNKANLRELTRRCLKIANEYKTAFEYEIYQRRETDEHLKLYDQE